MPRSFLFDPKHHLNCFCGRGENHTTRRCQLDRSLAGSLRHVASRSKKIHQAIPKDIDQEITKSPSQTNGTFPLTPPMIRKSLYLSRSNSNNSNNNNNLSNKCYHESYSFIIRGSRRRYYRPLLTPPSGQRPLRVCAMMQDYRRSYHASFAGSERDCSKGGCSI